MKSRMQRGKRNNAKNQSVVAQFQNNLAIKKRKAQ